MATPRTGNPEGAPQKDFLRDPDRFVIAFAQALRDIGLSQNKAFTFAVAWFEAPELAKPSPDGLKAGLRRALAAGRNSLVAFELPDDFASDDAENPWKRRVSTLIHKRDRKAKAKDSPEECWLSCMAHSFKTIILAARPDPRVASYIVDAASSVGEEAFARQVLLPMLSAKFEAPEFLPQI